MYIDAALPIPGRPAPVVPPELLAQLDTRATDGRLPPWLDWWPAEMVAQLLPDARTRESLRADMPRLPLAFARATVDIPARWAPARAGYVRLSAAYDDEVAAAAARGWPVTAIDGHHLSIITEPGVVADAVESLRV